jgi:hypothetical protein
LQPSARPTQQFYSNAAAGNVILNNSTFGEATELFAVTEVDGTQINFNYDPIYQLTSAQRGPTTYP